MRNAEFLKVGSVQMHRLFVAISVLAVPELLLSADNQSVPATLLSVQGSQAFQHGDLATAEQLFRAALDACPAPCSAEPTLRNELGRVLEDLSRLDEAQQEYRRVIEINKTSANPAELENASALNNLASIEQARDHWDASDELLNRAYSILEKNRATETELGGLVLSNIGLHAQKHGRYADARAAYTRSAALLQQTKGERSEEFARVLKNWALLDFESGKFQDAFEKNTRALNIENGLPYVSAADKAVTLNNVGLALGALERLAEAEKAYAESIKLVEDQPFLQGALAKRLNNLAMVEKEEGRLDAAAQHTRRALQLAQGENPKQDTTIASILNSMGLIALAQNRVADARISFERANALWLLTVGDEHPNYAATLSNLAVVASRQRRHKEAQQLLERALAIAEHNFGVSHPQVASILANIALELVHQKRYEEALQTYERAEQIQERSLGEHTAGVGRLWRDIAITYQHLNDFASAAAAYDKAIQGLRAASGADTPDLAIWLREYAEVLKKRREFGEAERAETESLRIQVRNTLKANQKPDRAGS